MALPGQPPDGPATYSRFRHLVIKGAKPAPSENQVAAIEALLGASLPTSFRDFLSVANGGYLDYVIDVSFGDGKTEPLCFCTLFSADEGGYCDETFLGMIRCWRENQQIPPGVLPFASDAGGSMVLLDLTAEGCGRIVAWVEGLPDWTSLRHESTYLELAKTFDEFVDKLKIDREIILDQLANDTENLTHFEATLAWLEIRMPSWREDSELFQAAQKARHRVTGRG